MDNNDKNSQKIEKMFDKIAPNYDFLNNIISFYTHYFIKTKSIKLLDFEPDSEVLDLCCGSGDLGRIILKKYPKTTITGVDFSSKMLDIARAKNKTKSKNIKYLKMDAQKLEFSDNSFDFVVMGFGFRNVENKELCLKEIYRVLKKDGVFLHLDFGQKNTISKIYDKIILFLINFFKNKEAYLYLINSKNNFLNPKSLIEKFKQEGFKLVLIKHFLFKNISVQVLKK